MSRDVKGYALFSHCVDDLQAELTLAYATEAHKNYLFPLCVARITITQSSLDPTNKLIASGKQAIDWTRHYPVLVTSHFSS